MNGQLLVNRMHTVTISPKSTVTGVKTGLTQMSKAFGADPAMLARIMVIPMPPVDNWALITHTDPYFDANGDSAIDIANASGQSVTINVLFVDMHSLAGPGGATDSYQIGH